LKVANCSKFVLSVLLLASIQAIASNISIPHSNEVYQFTEIEPDLVEIKLTHTGDVTYKNTATAMENTSLREVPEMVIDKDVIDFGYYADRYVHWQDLHAWDPWGILVADTDHNGMKEIIAERFYGRSHIPEEGTWFHAMIFELGDDGIFNEMYDYPDSTTYSGWAGDLDFDGNQEVILRAIYEDLDSLAMGNSIQCYEADAADHFATTLSFEIFPTLQSQVNHATLFDLDNDNQMEMIYFLAGGEFYGNPCASSTIIAEYDSVTNQFVQNYCFTQPAWYTSHYAIGDWDMDGQMEFATGGIDGEVYILETTGDDEYTLVYEGTVDTYNAYMTTTTNDMNGNGKPELWIGGDQSIPGGAETLITCFESSGDNQYEEVFKIRIPGIMSFNQYGVVNTDVDQDGVDELMIWVEDHIFILKNSGPESYEIIYAHFNDEWNLAPFYQIYYSTTSIDVNGDGYPELIISMRNNQGGDQYYFTEIYLPTGALLDLESERQPDMPFVINAYPNPFNRTIRISWTLSRREVSRVEIFDIRGRRLKNYHIKDLGLKGTNEFNWNGLDDNGREVMSGVYIVKVSGSNIQQSLKVMLIK